MKAKNYFFIMFLILSFESISSDKSEDITVIDLDTLYDHVAVKLFDDVMKI